MKDTLSEMKNNLQENSSRVDEAESQIGNLEYKEAKNTQSEQKEEKRIQKNEASVKRLWNNLKHSNIHIMGNAGRRRERKKLKIYFSPGWCSCVLSVGLRTKERVASSIPSQGTCPGCGSGLQ